MKGFKQSKNQHLFSVKTDLRGTFPTLNFKSGSLDLYTNKNELIDDSDENLLEAYLKDYNELNDLRDQNVTQLILNYNSIFDKSIQTIEFGLEFHYKTQFCSLLFKSTSIYEMQMTKMVDTLVRKNFLHFESDD